MEDLNEIFKLCDKLGITTIGQLKAIRQPNKNVLECLQEIRNKRFDFVYKYKMKKILDSMKDPDYFLCEICHIWTERKYEGADPNTCCDCNPPEYWENIAKNQRNDIE